MNKVSKKVGNEATFSLKVGGILKDTKNYSLFINDNLRECKE